MIPGWKKVYFNGLLFVDSDTHDGWSMIAELSQHLFSCCDRPMRIDSLPTSWIHTYIGLWLLIFIYLAHLPYLTLPYLDHPPSTGQQSLFSSSSFKIQQLLLICPVYGSIKIDWKILIERCGGLLHWTVSLSRQNLCRLARDRIAIHEEDRSPLVNQSAKLARVNVRRWWWWRSSSCPVLCVWMGKWMESVMWCCQWMRPNELDVLSGFPLRRVASVGRPMSPTAFFANLLAAALFDIRYRRVFR